MKTFDTFDGALLVDKPCGPTAHDIVAAVRRHFQFEKVGHAGTLDPNATGLLILLLGKGTKLSEKLMGSDKVYEGTARFGETTDSYDSDGEITSSLPVPPLTLDELNAYADQVTGDQLQTPCHRFGRPDDSRVVAVFQAGSGPLLGPISQYEKPSPKCGPPPKILKKTAR